MEFIREWIITIISVIIFITFVEILIPNSNHKRYINVVVGFLLMIIILKPLTKLMGGEIDFEEGIVKISNQIEVDTAKNRLNNIQYSNEDVVVKIYKNEIAKQLKERIEQNDEYLVEDILVEVVEEARHPDFGLIKSFNIALKENKHNKKIYESTIDPVEINVSLGRKINNTVEANSILISNEVDLIKDDLSKFYNVLKEDINIYILKSN